MAIPMPTLNKSEIFKLFDFLRHPAGPIDHIPAHRVVLSAVSPKLHNMCKEGGKVLVRNIQYRVLEEVVRFIYTGSIEMESDEDIENLRDGLDMLIIKIVPKKVHGDTNAN